MSFCPSGCTELGLVAQATNPICYTDPTRKNGIARVGFFKCSTEIPNPLTCSTLSTLVTAGNVVFTSELANVTFGEPQFNNVKLSDCQPPLRLVAGRQMTFDDKIAVRLAAIPAEDEEADPIPANPYFDRDFWKNKQQLSQQLRAIIVYCDGMIEVPRDENGDPIALNVTVYRDMDRTTVGDDDVITEVKRIQIDFKGDPLEMRAPEVDLSDGACSGIL